MSTQKIIPGLEDDTEEAPPDVEIAPPLARAGTFTGLVTPKSIQLRRSFTGLLTPKSLQPSRSQMLARMPTSRAEMLAKQNRAIAKIKAPSKKIATSERVAYRIDQYISTRRGQTASLSILGLMLMTLGGFFLKAVKPSNALRETVWEAWTYLADAGTHTALVEEGMRVVGVVMSLIGILYFSVIMGFVVDGIRAKMDMLKKGKSNVAEQNHTLLLGWSDKSVSLIRQICLANASENGGVIVVLAEIEKEELEAELESQIRKEELRGTRVIFRTGTPLLSVDLLKVSAHRARSIIIMAISSGDADRSDAAILRTVLSLKTLPELSGHIVAELRDIDNDPLLRLVGGNDVEILVSHDVIGRLVLMSARSPGLVRVYSALLGFEGNEFYFKAWPECVGVLFSGLAERFPNATPLGIKRKNGEVFICPKSDMAVEEGDEILVLAEDDDTYKACPPAPIEVGKVPVPPSKGSTQERILMCGWRRDIRDMIQLLDAVVKPGTELHMICEEPIKLRNKSLLESGLDITTLKNLRIVHHLGNTAIRRQLEKLPWSSFTSIMILSDQSRETDIMHSDSHSLASLLLIRDLQGQSLKMTNCTEAVPNYCKCISEILDPRTQRTISTSATILKLSEFIQSNELVSCILAMISESRDVRVILDELLGPQGAYFEVEPSARYCEVLEKVSFWQLAKRAMTRGDILCGYQVRGAEDTVLNPEGKDQPRLWSNTDMIVIRNAKNNTLPTRRSSLTVVNADDFERTTKSRQVKNQISRQRLLSAIIQDVDLSKPGKAGSDVERTTVMRALSSFAEDDEDGSYGSHSASFAFTQNRQTNVRSLIAAARMLADALEQAENSRSMDNDSCEELEETVSPFDV
ncbi:Ion channel [Phytophthora cactorum]|nr:Ion channel [Phytophthora cactorum]